MQRFAWSVRAIAQEAALQIALYPSFVVVADELALDFDDHLRLVDLALLDATQRAAVEALDDGPPNGAGSASSRTR